MAETREIDVYDNVLTHLETYTKKPESFVEVQNKAAHQIKDLIKILYDLTKTKELKKSISALPELIVEDFDDEQIWQELELQNSEKNDQFVGDVACLLAQKDRLKFPFSTHSEEEETNEDLVKSDVDASDGEENLSHEEDDDHHDEQEDNSSVESLGGTETIPSRGRQNNRRKPSSVVDDKFFKLGDMEEFLNTEDRKENRKEKKNHISSKHDDDDGESDDESVDYFQDIQSDSESEDENEDEGRKRECYADFFDVPDDENEEVAEKRYKKKGENDSEEEENMEDGMEVAESDMDGEGMDEGDGEENEDGHRISRNRNDADEKRVRFNLAESESGDESNDETSRNDIPKEDISSNIKSSFESRQERLKTRINHLEEKAVGEKPWQLMGEISATARPQNSLLEEVVDFDLGVRPAPVITQQTTMKLEDIIRQRIKDKAWDDVERKIKPVETPHEYKKKLVLNQEKSKLSLAEVYEKEYLKQRESLNPENQEKEEEEPESHKEIKKMMVSLFSKLDALANYHYTPKPAIPDVKVVSNLPAITMEEVAPVGTSDATLLAPEEVKRKPKGDLISKNERTETDKKRERRQKKIKQRERQKEKEKREKLVDKLKPGLGNKYSREKALKMLEKVTKDKNVFQMEQKGDGKAVKSSKAFFNQLQEEVKSHIKSKAKNLSKKGKEKISAKKLKL